MKKTIASVLCALLLAASVTYAADRTVGVTVNGKAVSFSDQQPVIIKGRTLLPISSVMTAMDKAVEWDEEASTAVIYDDTTEVRLATGDFTMLCNGNEITLDTAPVIINSRSCLPIRAIAEAFGAKVFWEDALKTVHIITEDVLKTDAPTAIGNEFRKTEVSLIDCGNCYCLNSSYLFSPVTIQDYNALRYADIVNTIAEKLPDANVYSMLIPDSYEIYAPQRFYTGQKRAIELVYSHLSEAVTPLRITEKLLEHAEEKIYFDTDHHWTQLGAFYAWETYAEEKGFEKLSLEKFEKADTDAFSGSYVQRMAPETIPEGLQATETMERFLPVYDATVTIYSDSDMTKMMGKVPLINTKNNAYSCFISGDHPLAVIKSSIGNGKKLAIIKESFGNALATWAVNNYEYVYVIDIRGFMGGKLHISDFYEKTKFDDLIIESYPTTVESNDLRGYLLEMAE